ncbi:hypothetical protein FK531_14705 [Rhodococcus spelaei]|uniref:YCII-related domain-containing protein n=1 Tax=Rhodococcus spelaei TaxID=2546320 RepID=A0A541B7P3_9NOCA|nr:YciI family protein [Rhodococcus spelaei]TQF68339.1 hypothetical protein FK531_14705 [Rhodococcus spelaei]
MAQYLALIYQDERALGDTYAGENMAPDHQAFIAANQAALADGVALEGSTTATCIRPKDGGSFFVSDGPFVETKEQLVGFYVIEAADLDEAMAVARQIPMDYGGIEIRPVRVFS